MGCSDRVDGEGLLRGPLFSLPAGQVRAVIGAEGGEERQDTGGSGNGITTRTLLQRKTYAVFGEARVPLLAEADSAKAERLALTLAGRFDHSNDFGGKATWQSGLL